MPNLKWEEIGSWNVGRPDGTSEKYILSRSKSTGDFQLKNDYGNTIIDMETMSGIEFIKKVLDAMKDEVGFDIDDDSDAGWFDDLLDDDDSTDADCDHID